MNDFKPQEHEKGQVVSRGNSNKYNPPGLIFSVNFCLLALKVLKLWRKSLDRFEELTVISTGMNQRGAGLKELLPSSTNEKPKQKIRRKPAGASSPNPNGSPPRRSSGNATSSDEASKHSRHNRSAHGSMDSSNDQDPSVRRRRSVPNTEVANHLPDGSAPPRKATSRPRKLKGSVGGEASMNKSSKGKPENSVDTCNDIIWENINENTKCIFLWPPACESLFSFTLLSLFSTAQEGKQNKKTGSQENSFWINSEIPFDTYRN